jgi:acetyl-CoA carboxylase biotin carboxyl carrier protein
VSISSTDITAIVGALQDSEWDEAVVVVGDVRIAVARNGAGLAAPAPAAPPAPAPAAPPAPTPAPPTLATTVAPVDASAHQVTAPSVGVFWQAPEPGAAPFVQVGSRVEVGDTVAIVEIMKLMNNVASDVAGVVTAVHVENGGTVEFGTPLLSISVEG